MQKQSLIKRLVYTAAFAALCCIATWLLVIPLPHGYFNVGDVFVLLAGWCLGPLFGGLAAGLGGALADVFSGYALYAPVTLIVKALMSMTAYYLYRLLKKCIEKQSLDFLPRAISAIVAEVLMVLGYFTFEAILYGIAGGAAGLLGNTMQGMICVFGGVTLVLAMRAIPFFKKYFPLLWGR